MDESAFRLNISSRETALLRGERDEIVYLHSDAGSAEAVFGLLSRPRPTLIALSADWSAELSPWEAKKAFRAGEDFTGKAPEYLRFLVSELIPAAESALGFTPEKRYIAGYSLAGLFAVWAQYKTNLFDGFASVSGSLWYDGFTEFTDENEPLRKAQKAYFSLGDREKKTKNARLSTVEDASRAAAERFSSLGAKTVFELNAGGHFNDSEARIAKGIDWLMNA
ncbi:MAG: alpha/beta hydrolase-fold protein [Eubacteriales bacterium]|nr:alpha/beta hydrolase-fold protein [Eubacteriales bacterium]MDD3883074.1 alpha/beta hydrolase-fold protein [Eubacteriales bacterium]MDD4513625.1 alpha/beta hydrolase-fold protein [Eubacteriales bacterium]